MLFTRMRGTILSGATAQRSATRRKQLHDYPSQWAFDKFHADAIRFMYHHDNFPIYCKVRAYLAIDTSNFFNRRRKGFIGYQVLFIDDVEKYLPRECRASAVAVATKLDFR